MLTGELQALEHGLAEQYRFVREAGRGGSGVVFVADDLKSGTQVAIKILRIELAGPRARQRFLREIDYSSRLDHSNILPLIHSGEVKGIMYYVMPFVKGESLQQRLKREGQLPIPEVLRLTRAVLQALDHAHDSGIVHRDVKPGNIMLDDDRVLVGDFGIARAIRRTASEEWVSSPGIHVGTPAYMSPEQAAGDDSLDGRSDLYSLGCVMYEMLAGDVPFTGATGTAVTARHALDPAPSLRTVRQTVPVGVERVILRALQKTPADRFRSASEMLKALDEASTPRALEETRASPARRFIRSRMAAIGVGVAATVWLAATFAWPHGPAPDRNSYVVFDFDGLADSQIDAAQRLRASLRSWTGIRVVDQFTLQSAVNQSARAGLTSRKARDAAVRLGSARYVRGQAQRDGDSIRLTATLFDVDSGQLAEFSERTSRLGIGSDSAFERLADRLLFPQRASQFTEPRIGTRSFPARRAYLAGQALLREWDLAAADSALFRADSLDPGYAQASLWLALSRLWRDEPTSRWRDFAERASSGNLTSRERSIADALKSRANGDVPASCAAFEALAGAERDDGFLWYSAAKCRGRDSVVVPDQSSPSGWRFRSSYRLALSHYEQALRLMPSIYRGMRPDGFALLRQLLKTTGNDLKLGRSLPPSNAAFVAYPTLLNDTLALLPILVTDVIGQTAAARRVFPDVPAAVRRQRAVLKEWATTWSSNYPESAEAWEAVAIALESLGDASSLDTIARARTLVRNDRDRLRVRGTEAWLRVKFSLPGNLQGLRRARLLADSVLREPRTPRGEQKLLTSLAALTGRLAMAKELAASTPNWPRPDVPVEVNRAAAQLLLHSSMGGSAGVLPTLQHRLDSLISTSVPPAARRIARRDLLGRAATLSYPVRQTVTFNDTSITGYPLFEAFRHWMTGDTAAVVKHIETSRSARQSIPPGDVQLDALLPETWLIAEAIGADSAAHWMDPTLAALRSSSQTNFLDPIRAASLVRSMALRADLASRLGDRAGAATWGAAVAELWENCDPELRPLRDRMRRLTR